MFINDGIFMIPGRGMMRFIKSYYGDTPIIGAEIGIYKGIHADDYLYKVKNIEKVYLVDLWKPYTEEGKQMDASAFKEGAKKRLRYYKNRVEFLDMSSMKAFKYLKKKKVELDFVYIDANHQYEYALDDIRHWWKLIKKGGILGGHDFCAITLGVVKAVMKFSEEKEIELHGSMKDWWFIK